MLSNSKKGSHTLKQKLSNITFRFVLLIAIISVSITEMTASHKSMMLLILLVMLYDQGYEC